MAGKNNNVIRRVEGLDEKELLASIAKMPPEEMPKDRKTVDAASQPQEAEENTEDIKESPVIETPANKRKTVDYKSAFLNPRELQARKCVYISMEIHATIVKIVSQIAEKGLSVGVYVDTVLRQHLETNKNEINALYRRRKDDLIK